MNKVFSRPNTYPISLGFNCHVKVFIDMLGEMDNTRGYARLPFDWIGTPMWAICDLFETHFEDFTNKDCYELKPRFTHKEDKYLTHTKYDFVFVHDYGKQLETISAETYAKVEEDYKRRVQRLDSILESPMKLLFIRLEQDISNRISLPEVQKEHDEYVYVEKFADLLKSKSLVYTILYLTTSQKTGFDKKKQICRIQYTNPENKIMGGEEIKQIIIHNQKFINMCLA
jgi:hypothetical protein